MPFPVAAMCHGPHVLILSPPERMCVFACEHVSVCVCHIGVIDVCVLHLRIVGLVLVCHE